MSCACSPCPVCALLCNCVGWDSSLWGLLLPGLCWAGGVSRRFNDPGLESDLGILSGPSGEKTLETASKMETVVEESLDGA